MTEKLFTKIYNTDEVIIDCFYCIFHSYDSFGDEDFEICEKGHIIYPNDCDDFKRESKRDDWNKCTGGYRE